MYQGQLSQRLDVVRTQARNDGSQNLPSTNATVPSDFENQLAAEARRHALEATSVLDKEMIQAKASDSS